MELLAPALALGLLGSAHCLSMCGAFAAAIGATCRGRGRWHFAWRMLAYCGGKTLTYVFLGVLVASAGAGALDHAAWEAWRRAALWLAAAWVALVALRVGGWLPVPRVLARPQAALARALGPLRGAVASWRLLPGPLGAAALGFLNGFLPCGLVVAGLLLAAASPTPGQSAAVMAVFGAGTWPALLLPALAARACAPAPRAVTRRALALLLLAFAAAAAWRGSTPGQPRACCSMPEPARTSRPA
ncbi:MAG: sulfite exporter TauE/SafE family protein [Planctomycetota bacterium]|nr:MAG: sulfite exporter TauE/SafE family protein [Planctomycetota bacterium]